MQSMRVLQYREVEDTDEVHSIRLAHETGEIVLEFDNVQVFDCEELVRNNLRESRHVIKEIIEFLKHQPHKPLQWHN